MRLTSVALVATEADGTQWAVTVEAKPGDVIVQAARPGFTDPEPVEVLEGVQMIPPSTLDGTWALAFAGVGKVEMRRIG